MKNYLLLLLVSFLFLIPASHSSEKMKVDNRGALMAFSFYNLEPGLKYEVRLSRAWFGTYTYKAPKDLVFGNYRHTLSFTAPLQPDRGSQFSSVNFTVGMFLLIDINAKIEVSVDLPSPAMMNLSIPTYKISETFMDEDPDPKRNSDRAVMVLDGLDGIDACIPPELFIPISESCPQNGDPANRLTSYGPIQATFYCCTVNPMKRR